ncbi:MAG: serine/threonine-protein kinase [Proteobacteria bacterium]|nr:serine/threonine-protein kinase [Pseudomonadota bacterium]
MADPIKSAPLPKHLGPYKVLEEVGVGGLGRVFKAIDERSGKTVAIKVLHDKFMNNRKFLGIFHRELLIMSSLNHRHIVTFLDSHFEPPLCYIVTEFIEGWSGYALYKKTGRMPPLVALAIIIDMLQGVDHLHLHNVIHSDLSAANYLVERTGRVLVTDFGLSCKQEIEDYRNYMVGTPGYYSPEHITEQSIVPQTDLYCAGLILFELLAGQKAVTASSDRHKTLANMKKIDFSLVQSTDPKMQKMIHKFLEKALNPNVSRRYESADQMMFACYEILKKYEIRFARHAIKQYLIDKRLVKGPFTGQDQKIYIGF